MGRSALFLPQYLAKGIPPSTSYWVDCDRAELNRRIDARRSQMAVPKWTGFEPAIEAEADLRTRLAMARATRARR